MRRIQYIGLFLLMLGCLILQIFGLEKSSSYEVFGTKRNIRVEYSAGREAWAIYVLEKSREFLVSASTYLGRPISGTAPILICGKEEVLFALPGFAYTGKPIGGSNYGDRVEIAYSLSEPGKPGLLYHELGHYWFGTGLNDSSTNWLYEGIVSYLPLALKAEGLLDLDPATLYWIEAHWQDGVAQDTPLERDIRNDPKDSSFALFYAKTFQIQKIIGSYLGKSAYKNFLLSLLQKQALTNDEVLNLLKLGKAVEWKVLLSGWVFGSNYLAVPKDALLDNDSDGLTWLQECDLGTDPLRADTDGDGLSDGSELELELDPLTPIDPAQRDGWLAKAGIRVDGLSSDWEGKGRLIIPDLADDVSVTPATRSYAPLGFDILSLECVVRDGGFHILVRTKGKPVRTPGVMFDCMLDTNGDFWPDMEFAFRLDKPDEAWLYTAHDKRSVLGPEYRGALSDCIELLVPLGSIPETFSVFVILRDEKEGRNLDESNAWFPVSLTELRAVERFGLETNLRSSDSDGDGIPDRYEIELGLDPRKKDPASIIAQKGPFVDGVSFDWSALPFTKFIDKEGGTDGADIDYFGYYTRGGVWYFLIILKSAPLLEPGRSFHLICDLDGDGQADREFSFMLDSPETPWVYESKTGMSRGISEIRAAISEPNPTSTTCSTGLSKPTGTQAGFCIELCVPADFLKGSSLHVYPILRNMEGAFNYDEFGVWLPLQKPQ